MVVKKDLQLIVCPCVFEPWALLLLRVSTLSSLSRHSTQKSFSCHAVHRRPFLCFSQSLPFSLCVLKLFLLVCFPIIYSLPLSLSLTLPPPAPPLTFHLLQLNSCWVQSCSKNTIICFTHARDHVCFLQALLKNSPSSVSACFCSF